VSQAMLSDKKRRDGKLRLVLPEGIGSVRVVEDVPMGLVLATLRELQ
jgi:3-dehydroquinate synthetase